MREILFRGRFATLDDNDNLHKLWIYGDLRQPLKNLVQIRGDVEGWQRHGTTVTVDPETVGQFTGLFDKNGRKIFEGDIFKFKDETWTSCYTSCGTEYDSYEVENYGVVGFEADYGAFDFVQYKFGENSVEADLHENRDLEFPDFVRGLEIVGNIYDNPELMEVSESEEP